jgi:hypothetical protein
VELSRSRALVGAVALPCGAALIATAVLSAASYTAFLAWLAYIPGFPSLTAAAALESIQASPLWMASAAACVLGLLAFLRRSRWAGPALVALSLGGHASLLAIQARQVIASVTFAGCQEGSKSWVVERLQEEALLVVSAGVLIGAGGLLTATRMRSAGAAALAAISALTGGAMLAFVAQSTVSPDSFDLQAGAALRSTALDGMRWTLQAVWATAGMWAAHRFAHRRVLSRADLGVLAFGAATMAAAAPLTHDAFGPMPVVQYEVSKLVKGLPPPPAHPCDPQGYNPVLEFEDGRPILSGFVPSSEEEIRERLSEMRKQYEDLHALARDEAPFPGELDVLAPVALPMDVLRPALRAARAAGYPRVNVVSVIPRDVDSWTAGRLHFPERCAVHAELSPAGHSFSTWGDLARAAAAGEVSVRP